MTKTADNDIVGMHLDNEHLSVCLSCVEGFDVSEWRELPQKEANEFGDVCQICSADLWMTHDTPHVKEGHACQCECPSCYDNVAAVQGKKSCICTQCPCNRRH